MSYNPTRLENKNRQRPTPGLEDGTRHSHIVKKYGGASLIPNAANKIKTQLGYQVPLFASADFVTRHEVMHQASNTGLGYSETGDRTILVRRGTLFVAFENESGVRESVKLPNGNCFHAPRGMKYGLATSGVDGVELYITESVDYEKGWKALEAVTIGQGHDDIQDEVSVIAAPVRRQANPVTVAQAQEMATASATHRRQPRATGPVAGASSTNAVGVNLRPSGPPVEE